jgi:transcriptional regulator with XRE-family HTH domain
MEERPNIQFGAFVFALRSRCNLSLRDLASEIGISAPYLHRIEQGKIRNPSQELVKALTESLSPDPDFLFKTANRIDLEIVEFINNSPNMLKLIRLIKANNFSKEKIETLIKYVETLKTD